MSQENVELLYRAYDAFNERNLDAFLALMDADVELIPFERALEGGGSYRGHSGVRSWWNDAFAVLPDFRVEPEEIRDLGDWTLTRGRLRGHGAKSSAVFERVVLACRQMARQETGLVERLRD